MLIDEIVDYCNKEYNSANTKYLCKNCMHPTECSGSCKSCLEQVHYPSRNSNGLRDYKCRNIIDFYACTYLYKYASEIYYLIKKCECLNEIEELHIMSIGCGASPDLMAFEKYCNEKETNQSIAYVGFDKNKLWRPIHEKIKEYAEYKDNMRVKFKDEEIFDYLGRKSVSRVNVLIMQYVISHFYNTEQIGQIEKFFDELVYSIVKHKETDNPLVIIINDVNSCYRGRNYFEELVQKLDEEGVNCTSQGYYFDYGITNVNQRYGKKHGKNNICFSMQDGLEEYEPWGKCSGAQMLIEVR